MFNPRLFTDSAFSYHVFLSLFFIGLGYILLLPIFEGFDETAHYSRIREISKSPSTIFNKESYLDQVVIDYKGPVSYSSGYPPYSHGNTYDNFFKTEVSGFKSNYLTTPLDREFQASDTFNWQIQHPPLYYLFGATINKLIGAKTLVSQVFTLRLVSYITALFGVFFSILACNELLGKKLKGGVLPYQLGFLIYPLIFPMFFLEFARVGNDSLCLFFTGLLAYSLSKSMNEGFDRYKSMFSGIILGLGLLTKAFFIPISVAVAIFLFVNIYDARKSKNLIILYIKKFIYIFSPAILIGGGWYLFKMLILKDYGLGVESSLLDQQGGLIHGLKDNFSLLVFCRGLLVPFVSFFWAGSWSLVRFPAYTYIPLIVAVLWMVIEYASIIKSRIEYDLSLLLKLLIFVMYLGLAWHVLISMAINGIATSPGWYLHILLPWIAPVIGIATFKIIKHKIKKIIFILLMSYAFLFQLAAIWSHSALFSGCASKGDDKQFLFTGKMYCLDHLPLVLNNLSSISFPYLAALSFLIGFSILIYSILKYFTTSLVEH